MTREVPRSGFYPQLSKRRDKVIIEDGGSQATRNMPQRPAPFLLQRAVDNYRNCSGARIRVQLSERLVASRERIEFEDDERWLHCVR